MNWTQQAAATYDSEAMSAARRFDGCTVMLIDSSPAAGPGGLS
jgi:hypothetical protein